MQGYAQPIAMQLQETGHVRDALYRESTKYVDGKFIKVAFTSCHRRPPCAPCASCALLLSAAC